jgi:hypothetical protein
MRQISPILTSSFERAVRSDFPDSCCGRAFSASFTSRMCIGQHFDASIFCERRGISSSAKGVLENELLGFSQTNRARRPVFSALAVRSNGALLGAMFCGCPGRGALVIRPSKAFLFASPNPTSKCSPRPTFATIRREPRHDRQRRQHRQHEMVTALPLLER